MKSKLNFLIEYVNGEIFDMHNLGLWVSSFHIFSPDAERRTIERPKGNGSFLVSSRIKTRKIEIGFEFEAEDIQSFDNLKHDIFRMFYTKEEFKIVRDISPNKELYAIQEGDYDIDNITMEDGEFSIELTMLDPLIYGIEEELVLGDYPIRNEGNEEATPIIIVNFTSSATEYKIEHSNGKFVRIIYNFDAGDKLEVDLSKRKVFINNVLNMHTYYWRNNPFNLMPGENILTVTPSDVAKTTIKFKPRWL